MSRILIFTRLINLSLSLMTVINCSVVNASEKMCSKIFSDYNIFTSSILVLNDLARLQIQIQFSNIQQRSQLLDKFNIEVKRFTEEFGANILRSNEYQNALKKELSIFLQKQRDDIQRENIRKKQIAESRGKKFKFGEAEEIVSINSESSYRFLISKDGNKVISLLGEFNFKISIFDRVNIKTKNNSFSLGLKERVGAVYRFGDDPDKFAILILGHNQSKVHSRIVVYDMNLKLLHEIKLPSNMELVINPMITDEMPSSRFVVLGVIDESDQPKGRFKNIVLDLVSGQIIHTRDADSLDQIKTYIFDNSGHNIIGTTLTDKYWIWDYIDNKQHDYFDLQSTHYIDHDGYSNNTGYYVHSIDSFNNLYLYQQAHAGGILKVQASKQDLGVKIEDLNFNLDFNIKIEKNGKLAIAYDSINKSYKLLDTSQSPWVLLNEVKADFYKNGYVVDSRYGFVLLIKGERANSKYEEIQFYNQQGRFVDSFSFKDKGLFVHKLTFAPEKSELLVELTNGYLMGKDSKRGVISIPIKDLGYAEY